MRHFFILLRHELRGVLLSPSTYLASFFFLLVMGFLYQWVLEDYNRAPHEMLPSNLFLNMFFSGSLKAMPPKLLSDDKKNVVIRPLAYCKEKDLVRYADYKEFPIIPCNLCGSQENLQRQQIKNMLHAWEREYPGRTETIFRSIRNVAPSQLADSELFDFHSLRAEQIDTDLHIPVVNVVNL